MSRAFVKEDAPEGPLRGIALPARDDPAFPLAAARALLAGADQGDTGPAEAATGCFFGDPGLVGAVNTLLDDAIARGDERMEQLARRFLRRAGAPREE